MKMMAAAFLLLYTINGFAQTKEDPAIVMYDAKWKLLPAANASIVYIGKYWKDGERWFEQDFYFIQKTLAREAFYSDSARKIKQGICANYHRNGLMSDSGAYDNNRRVGEHLSWHTNGEQRSVQHFKNGIAADTSLRWDNEGKLRELSVTDDSGNGFLQLVHANGKLQVSGKLESGKKTGTWTYRSEEGIPVMSVIFSADSVVNQVCYEADGKTPSAGVCIFEKIAEFKGGSNGWRRYLEQNLRYPQAALDQRIQGMVQVDFQVDQAGKVSDFNIISSPGESLSEEVIRLLKAAPKWTPAIQYNKPVIYRLTQAVTFAM